MKYNLFDFYYKCQEKILIQGYWLHNLNNKYKYFSKKFIIYIIIIIIIGNYQSLNLDFLENI